MRRVLIEDFKLLAVGVGIGGLICAFAVGNPICAAVGTGGAGMALFFRLVEARL